MSVSLETLRSLQILPSDSQPSSHAQSSEPNGSGVKGNLSVYGLLHPLACTAQGRSTLRKICLRPSLNLDTILERQSTIAFLHRPDNIESVGSAVRALRKMKNAKFAISQLQKGVDSPSTGKSFDKGSWSILRDFAARSLRLREIIGAMSGSDTMPISHEVRLRNALEDIVVNPCVADGPVHPSSRAHDCRQSHREEYRL